MKERDPFLNRVLIVLLLGRWYARWDLRAWGVILWQEITR